MNADTFLSALRQLVAQDKLDEALSQLNSLLENSPLLNDALQLAGRFAGIRKQVSLGTVSHADATLNQNQIRAGLLDLIQEIETQQATQPAIQKEIGRAVAGKTIIQNADKIYNIDHIDEANFS